MAKRKVPKSRRPPLRLEWIEAGSLAANPDNWRRHPPQQAAAFKHLLDDVGWAGALLYNRRTRRLIDGHLRQKAVGPRTPVPVLVGSWTAEQEKKILATLDPLGDMATADPAALEALLAEVDLSDEAMGELAAELDGQLERAGERQNGEAEARKRKKTNARQRRISELFSVIVECKNEREQLAFYRRMQKEGRKCKLYVL